MNALLVNSIIAFICACDASGSAVLYMSGGPSRLIQYVYMRIRNVLGCASARSPSRLRPDNAVRTASEARGPRSCVV